MTAPSCDVIVVGGGNAALCAALAATEHGARVLVLERAPEEQRGGNSAFTGGGMRMVHNGLETVLTVVPDLSESEKANTDFGSYSAEQYFDDLGRLTQYYCDPDLAETLVNNSTSTVQWLHSKGVKFLPFYGSYSVLKNDRRVFFGGTVLYASGGGQGLVDAEIKSARAVSVEIRFNHRVMALLEDASGVHGVRVRSNGVESEIRSKAVVLACGGFEANREMRARYLGTGWDMATVRGTRYNTGDGLRMALEVGAQPYGQWSGCHAVAWERNAPQFGDLSRTAEPYRHSYPWGIMVNAHGRRFVDEGADFRNYTYAKYGRVVLEQPGSFAWQVFDSQVLHLLRGEYKLRGATKVRADSLEELVEKMQDVNPAGFLETVREYNAAVRKEVPFDPEIKDGRRTSGLAVDKTNWANTIEKAPFEAYSVGCGITFTFGGVKIDTKCHVLDIDDKPVAGLYAAGEMVGGLFYFNYPGSSGLMAGAVFGRISGRSAGAYATSKQTGGGE
jgi:tricarballylate dehydrogenase